MRTDRDYGRYGLCCDDYQKIEKGWATYYECKHCRQVPARGELTLHDRKCPKLPVLARMYRLRS